MTKRLTRRFAGLALILMSGLITTGAMAGEDEAAGPSVYERLGEMDGITQIVTDTVALHHKNPKLAHFFDGIDDAVTTRVATFAHISDAVVVRIQLVVRTGIGAIGLVGAVVFIEGNNLKTPIGAAFRFAIALVTTSSSPSSCRYKQ